MEGGDGLKKKSDRSRQGKGQCNNRGGNALPGNYIVATDHAINRYQERIRMMNAAKTQYAIIEGVKRSKLIALTKSGGREIRENKGIVFVCELQGSYMYVITVLISRVDLRFVG